MTWEEKRKEILKRDNYTCKICGQFNPELGEVQLTNSDGHLELHHYSNDPNTDRCTYDITLSKNSYSFEINFGDCWPVFPIMQVHHIKYINGRESWDYNNEDLITLCKRCHCDLHLTNSIPIYNKNYELIESKMFVPVDLGCGRHHNCEEWTFIKKIGGGEYILSNINPSITFLAFADEDSEEILEQGKAVLDKFINNYFPRYSKKQ